MASNSQDSAPKVVTRVRDWRQLVREAWADKWNQRDTAYRFSNGYEKQDTGSDGGPYSQP